MYVCVEDFGIPVQRQQQTFPKQKQNFNYDRFRVSSTVHCFAIDQSRFGINPSEELASCSFIFYKLTQQLTH